MNLQRRASPPHRNCSCGAAAMSSEARRGLTTLSASILGLLAACGGKAASMVDASAAVDKDVPEAGAGGEGGTLVGSASDASAGFEEGRDGGTPGMRCPFANFTLSPDGACACEPGTDMVCDAQRRRSLAHGQGRRGSARGRQAHHRAMTGVAPVDPARIDHQMDRALQTDAGVSGTFGHDAATGHRDERGRGLAALAADAGGVRLTGIAAPAAIRRIRPRIDARRNRSADGANVYWTTSRCDIMVLADSPQ
jgi:hypothetical protein